MTRYWLTSVICTEANQIPADNQSMCLQTLVMIHECIAKGAGAVLLASFFFLTVVCSPVKILVLSLYKSVVFSLNHFCFDMQQYRIPLWH